MKKFLKRMLLAALLCVPWVTQAQTDTLTVADGTNTNSYIPFYGTWMDADQHNQVIYPASMTANIVGDSITGIGFYMSSTNSTAWNAPVTISLGITSDAALTGIDNNTVLTQVWQGTINGQGDSGFNSTLLTLFRAATCCWMFRLWVPAGAVLRSMVSPKLVLPIAATTAMSMLRTLSRRLRSSTLRVTLKSV